MAIWDWPKCWRATTQSQFYLASSSLSSKSPYTGQLTVYGPAVQVWTAKLTFPRMKADDDRMSWREVQAFVSRLKGISGMLRIVDYHRMKTAYDQYAVDPAEQNWSDGTPFSDGHGWVEGFLPPTIEADDAAEEGATSLVVRGLPVNLDKPLRMGDLFEVRPNGIPATHGHLYECVANVKTNGDGKTRLYFEPPLRKGVAAGDMIVIRYPTGVFRLASEQEGVVQRSLLNRGDMGFSLSEVLPWQ